MKRFKHTNPDVALTGSGGRCRGEAIGKGNAGCLVESKIAPYVTRREQYLSSDLEHMPQFSVLCKNTYHAPRILGKVPRVSALPGAYNSSRTPDIDQLFQEACPPNILPSAGQRIAHRASALAS
jgi:hypothetical protein